MAQWEEKFAAEVKWYQKLDKVDDQLGINVPCELTLGAGHENEFSEKFHKQTVDHTKLITVPPIGDIEKDRTV